MPPDTNGQDGRATYFADPFVLLVGDVYFAYGTDAPDRPTYQETGRQFPVLHSKDLQTWKFVGGALVPPSGLEDLAYWAPEVANADGRFVMYYSAGGEQGQNHKLRAAVSKDPAGPFTGQDLPLLPDESFSIDAHPFQDPVDGRWYLFFAKDFFDAPAGTGIAVAPLSDDLLTVSAPPQTILRAQAEWQIFERDRVWYGKTWPSWYCVEGPFVVYRQGKYWLFYSGGRWEASDYGVGCAVSDHVLGPYVDPHMNDGPSVLRTIGDLRGPGHNSVVLGPDGNDYICFHAWDHDFGARRLHVSGLEWAADGPRAI